MLSGKIAKEILQKDKEDFLLSSIIKEINNGRILEQEEVDKMRRSDDLLDWILREEEIKENGIK